MDGDVFALFALFMRVGADSVVRHLKNCPVSEFQNRTSSTTNQTILAHHGVT